MKVVFLFLSLLTAFSGLSQEERPFSISVMPKAGLLFAHRPTMSHLIKKRNTALEVEFSQQDNSKTAWSSLYRFPSRGFSVIYHDFGNREVLGTSVALFRFTKFPLIQSNKWGFLDFRLGNGVAYITKKYNAFNNIKNIAIGSHINGFVNFSLAYTKRFNRFYVGAGFDFSHFSNASLKMPNQGLNTLTASLTAGFELRQREVFNPNEFVDTLKNVRPKNKWHFHFITGLKQNIPSFAESRTFGLAAIQGLYIVRVNRKWDAEFGVDVMYNEANRWLNNVQPSPIFENIQAGGYVGMALTIYATQIYFGIGAYGLNINNPGGWIYDRIGARWLVNDRFDLMLGIKAHFGIADYLEWGIGYRL